MELAAIMMGKVILVRIALKKDNSDMAFGPKIFGIHKVFCQQKEKAQFRNVHTFKKIDLSTIT